MLKTILGALALCGALMPFSAAAENDCFSGTELYNELDSAGIQFTNNCEKSLVIAFWYNDTWFDDNHVKSWCDTINKSIVLHPGKSFIAHAYKDRNEPAVYWKYCAELYIGQTHEDVTQGICKHPPNRDNC